jgi:hypothetical protein
MGLCSARFRGQPLSNFMSAFCSAASKITKALFSFVALSAAGNDHHFLGFQEVSL